MSRLIVIFAFGIITLSVTPSAHANLGACGNIHVEAEAECMVVGGVECEGMCTIGSVEAACAAKLAADCEGDCDEFALPECQAECTGDCRAECEIDEGEFSCDGGCDVDCSARCGANCEADEDSARCEASCGASCEHECDLVCHAEPPSADCETKCELGCEGSCTTEVNLDCQVDCQAEGFVECEVDVEGECEARCESEEGAVFCDSSYVDHGDNLQECLDALEAELNIEIEAMSEGECDGDGCQGSASAKVSSDCTVASVGSAGAGAPAALLMAGFALLVLATRRRASRRIHTPS